MTGLLASELRRLISRRLVKVVVGLAILAVIVASVIVLLTQHYEIAGLAGVIKGTSLAFVAIGWVIGASSVGADWHAGVMTTILTWEPRRARVIWTKVAACLGSVFVLTLIVQALLAGLLAVAAALTGSTAGADGTSFVETAAVALRSAVLGSFCAGLGFGIASIGRNTAAALGVGFGYMLIVENVVRGLKPEWAPWLLTDNAAMFIVNERAAFPQLGRGVVGTGLYLAALTGVLLFAAATSFRSRDVT